MNPRILVPLLAVAALGAGSAQDRPRIRPRSEAPPLDCIPQPKFEQGFELRDGDVVAFTGGTRIAKLDDRGYVESMLTLAAKEKKIYFRNMGWQADTVYEQRRPLDFGSQGDQLKRAGVTVVVSSFGLMEALDGEGRIPEFIAAYERLLDEYAACTGRIALVTPTPFGKSPLPGQPDLTMHNRAVVAYAEAIRKLAAGRGYPCVVVSGLNVDRDTTDGIQLTAEGEWRYATEIVTQLLHETPFSARERKGEGFTNPEIEAWRKQIMEKNRLWREHWRPTNWAFAYGDRQEQPSSHDHRPGMPRWFPAELDGIIPAIESAEDAILETRKELGR
jgi:hypothetical protein